MKYFLETIFPIMIAFMIFELPIIMLPKKNKDDFSVPFAVKMSSIIEAMFAIIFLVVGIVIVGFSKYNFERVFKVYVMLFIIAVSMAGLILAAHLNNGNKKARNICLIFSLIRIPTLVGIFFSVSSIYLLYFNRASKSYFKNKGGRS